MYISISIPIWKHAFLCKSAELSKLAGKGEKNRSICVSILSCLWNRRSRSGANDDNILGTEWDTEKRRESRRGVGLSCVTSTIF